MDDPLADDALVGSVVGGESNVNALLARGVEAGSSGGAGLLGGTEKLARCSKEKSMADGWCHWLLATVCCGAEPICVRFACQVAGAAERAGSSSCSWSLALDGGPGGSDGA